jgi:hypothetical protein
MTASNWSDFPGAIFIGDMVKTIIRDRHRRSRFELGEGPVDLTGVGMFQDNIAVFVWPQDGLSDEAQLDWVCRRGVTMSLDDELSEHLVSMLAGATALAVASQTAIASFIPCSKFLPNHRGQMVYGVKSHLGAYMVGPPPELQLRIRGLAALRAFLDAGMKEDKK